MVCNLNRYKPLAYIYVKNQLQKNVYKKERYRLQCCMKVYKNTECTLKIVTSQKICSKIKHKKIARCSCEKEITPCRDVDPGTYRMQCEVR